MKILILCYEYPPIGGGGGVGAQQYAEAWAAEGHEVLVVTSWAPGLKFHETISNVEIERVFTLGNRSRAIATFIFMLSYVLFGAFHGLRHLRRLRKFDLLNTHFSLPTGPVGTFFQFLLGIPNVLTIIGGDIYDPTKALSPHRILPLKRLNELVINRADRVVAISRDTRKRARQHYRIRKPIQVVPYGFTPLRLEEPKSLAIELSEKRFYLIFVGRLIERKGIQFVIRALNLLPDEIHLILVGDGPLEALLKSLASRENVLPRVHFVGFRTRGEILSLLKGADCFVLPSLHEGLGIVVQEAMFAGLPVVATNNGGQVDLIQEGRNGLLVAPRNVRELARAIQRVYQEPALAESMSRNNRHDIRSYFMADNCRLYLEIFSELAGRQERDMVLVQAPQETEKLGSVGDNRIGR